MIKLCYWLRAISAVIAVGAMGSLQLDTIDWWTWFCQTMLGVVTWILVGYWIDDIKYYENKCADGQRMEEENTSDVLRRQYGKIGTHKVR